MGTKKYDVKNTNMKLSRVTDDGKSLRVKLVDENNADITAANPLEVNAAFTGTLAVNLDSADDEVTVYGSSDGGTTRQVVHTDASGDLQVDILSIAAGTNQVGGIFTTVTTATTNQVSQFRSLTVDSTAQAVKASAGNLYGWNIINLHSATIYVKIYNVAAGSVNPASDVPVRTLMVPASGSVFVEPKCVINANSTAISVRAVTDSGDTGTTAPGTLPIIELMYA